MVEIGRYWQNNYTFRYKILDFTSEKMYKRKLNLVDQQEKNLAKMENLYGKRTATFLRGAIMKERKDQFIKREKKNEEYKRRKSQEIELSE